MKVRSLLLTLAILSALPLQASAKQYSFQSQVDMLPTLGPRAANGFAHDAITGNLWTSSGLTGTDLVIEVDSQTGALVSSFATSFPDFSNLTLDPVTGNLLVSKSTTGFGQMELYTQAGQLVHVVPNPPSALATEFDSAGNLYILAQPAFTNSPVEIQRIDLQTGAILASHFIPVLLQGSSTYYKDLEFDYITGNLFLLSSKARLYEVDLQSGSVVNYSGQLGYLFGGNDYEATFCFQRTGNKVFFFSNFSFFDNLLSVVGRSLEAPIKYCSGDDVMGGCPCGNESPHTNLHTGCAKSSGAGAIFNFIGSSVVASNAAKFSVISSTPNTFGLVFSGTASISATPIGDGLRCVGGALMRFDPVFVPGTGNLTWDVDLTQAGGVSAGDWRYYQWWFRDINGPCGSQFNVSNAVSLRWH